MSKRIHELAKEWSVQPKDLVAGLEKLGIRGKRSQSSLTDEEVQRVRETLGLYRARPGRVAPGGGSPSGAGPSGKPAGATPPPPPAAAAPAPAAERPLPPPPAAAPAPAAPSAATAAPAERPRPARQVPGPVPAPPPPGFEEMRGVKVLGKIDLRKPAPPAPSPGARGAEPAPGVEGAAADGAPKKKKGRKVIKKSDMLDSMERDFMRGGKRPQKRRALPGKEQKKTEITVPRASKRVIRISEVITVADLARAMGVKAGDVLKKLLDMGMMATINQALDHDTAALVAAEFEHQVENVAFDVEQMLEAVEAEGGEEKVVVRAPVVTMMGHVDHGKTSLLDAIRSTNVAEGEAGGITQHIGAYAVEVNGRQVTFLDTPGHEAFTAMRARGAKVTDIVILVVAADDGVMPQTAEAINHARAAEVPIIVAINKIDKPQANPNRVRTGLLQHEIVVESMGGDVLEVEVSALKGTNLDKLLDTILLQAEVLDLKANPDREASGIVVEAQLDRGRGPVATVLVQRGTLHLGDIFVAGSTWGRVRALINDKSEHVKEAEPSVPVEVLGLGSAPEAGDQFVVVENEARAREITDYRERKRREQRGVASGRASLEQMMSQLKEGARKEFHILVKADVQGSAEAIVQALEKIGNEEIGARVMHYGVGGISESDVQLAAASGAVILGFNVRANGQARSAAERDGIEIRYYNIIYDLVDDIKKAMSGLLAPTLRETFLGNAEILEIFNITKVGKVAGCRVTEGSVQRGAKVRLIRDNVVIHEGTLSTLKRFKDEVREVPAGQECGMAFANYQDIRAGDVIECFNVETIARSL